MTVGMTLSADKAVSHRINIAFPSGSERPKVKPPNDCLGQKQFNVCKSDTIVSYHHSRKIMTRNLDRWKPVVRLSMITLDEPPEDFSM